MEADGIELRRTDSICPLPQNQLLDYVETNNIPKIESLVGEHPEVINLTIGHPYDKPILYIACFNFANVTNATTIETLISLGANLYHSDELHNRKEAIHFATLGQNPTILKTIIDSINEDRLNALSLGNTALNLLIKEGDEENSNFVKCAEILVKSNLDVNKTDGKNKSPIFWAAKKNYKEVVEIILNKSKREVIVNEFVSDYLKKNNIRVPYKPELGQNNNNNLLDVLFGYIKANDEESFVRCKHLESFVDADDGESTFLQLATERNLRGIVQTLLEQGVDPNKTTLKRKTAPIELAVERGYHGVLSLLLQHQQIILPADILVKSLERIDEESVSPEIDYNECYALLMSCKRLNVNASNEFGTTALHCAAKYGGAEKTLDLLRKGASLASTNKFRSLPIEDIDANVLETHLNECLEINVDVNVEKENFKATYNYKTLMPPQKLIGDAKKVDVETASSLIVQEIQQLASETQVISYMSKSAELRHLLKHPVITSFLYMKWHRIRQLFYTNLAFYTLFCLLLITYIVIDDQNEEQLSILSVCLGVTFGVLILRELFQILVSPKTYFFDWENYLEVALIVLTSLILFNKNFSEDAKRQISAVAILLAAFELVILIGQVPKMTTHIVMLKTVSKNFLRFLLLYSILIIAFSLSFYTLFKERNENNTEGPSDEQKFFVNPGISLFKTVVMLTGEFDASSIEFQSYPILSHLIFMLFVFMISIILFNLLNGLAVSDTQIIQSNAEMVGYIARIEHIAYIESMIFGHLLPKTLLSYCHCFSYNLPNKLNVPGLLIGRISLFPHYLKNYKLTILPNQCAKVVSDAFHYSELEGESKGCVKSNLILDYETAERTKQLIKAKKEEAQEEKRKRRALEEQEKIFQEQKRVIAELRSEQKIILSQLEDIVAHMRK